MQQEAGRIAKLRSQPLAGAPFWLIILVLWGVMELAWRWRRVRARGPSAIRTPDEMPAAGQNTATPSGSKTSPRLSRAVTK